MSTSNLGEQLRGLRGGLSLYEVGKDTGIQRSNLGKYERGELLPPKEVLKKLAAFYEVSYKDLYQVYLDEQYQDPEELAFVLDWARKKL